VDIGANIGNHAIHISRFTKCPKIILFEPNEKAINIRKKNLSLNDCENVDTRFLGIALGARDTRLKAATPDPNNLGHTVFYEDETGEVLAVPGGALLLDLDEQVRFIKIDVESMELDILVGLDQTIARWRPNIFIEVWDDKQHPFLDWCASKSYEIIERFQRYPGIQNYLIRPISENASGRGTASTGEAWFALLRPARSLRDRMMKRASFRRRYKRFVSGLTGQSRCTISPTTISRHNAPSRPCFMLKRLWHCRFPDGRSHQ
jgi:FkbM family methyltransferase